ncbi:hypothetical protein GINT2_001376 [Glugoides intestinalis]
MKIKIQFLASEIEAEIDFYESIDALKKRVEDLFSIPIDEQSLFFDDRNISTSSKPLSSLGLKDGSLIMVKRKRVHKIAGTMRSGGLSSLVKNPMVKSMLKNPSTIKTMQEMFPGLKDEMEVNSSLKMLLNTEGMEEELERVAADDEYINTQMRNADITMAKLQNLPDGIRIMSSAAKDAQGISFQMPMIDLRSGETLSAKNTKAIPGRNSKNYLVEYRKQLLELKNIGFENVRENLEILKSVDGDLQLAQQTLFRKNDDES